MILFRIHIFSLSPASYLHSSTLSVFDLLPLYTQLAMFYEWPMPINVHHCDRSLSFQPCRNYCLFWWYIYRWTLFQLKFICTRLLTRKQSCLMGSLFLERIKCFPSETYHSRWSPCLSYLQIWRNAYPSFQLRLTQSQNGHTLPCSIFNFPKSKLNHFPFQITYTPFHLLCICTSVQASIVLESH